MALMRKREVLITGAGGFIGRHTVQRCLRHHCTVYALVRRQLPPELRALAAQTGRLHVIQADITDAAQLDNNLRHLLPLDAIIHCAGKVSDLGSWADFEATNVLATQRLARFAKNNKCLNFVFISSTDVYGLRNFKGESEEELSYDLQARNPYPRSKILAEEQVRKILPETHYTIVRPAAVWGEDDPTLTRRIRNFLQHSPRIVHFGRWKGRNRWPLAHVEQVALAAYLAAFHPEARGRAINVLDPDWTSIDDFYHKVAARYFPERTFRRLCLPFWCGLLLGGMNTALARTLRRSQPLFDPTLYALYSISHNLDFSSARFERLKATAPIADG